MPRKSFDDGHQNRGHAAGFDLTFQVMHDLFHPPPAKPRSEETATKDDILDRLELDDAIERQKRAVEFRDTAS